MKTILKSISIIAILVLASLTQLQAQDKNTIATAKFKVWGNCEMCKKTIEGSLDTKGVKSANWNIETKIIEVVYQPAKISEDKLHDLIAASGYDTEKKTANDKAYQSLPGCCQYERKN
ncbi:MAG: cation transporter [Cytophagales bacterium]|nr:cation transporter [Cytophagales bacterium]